MASANTVETRVITMKLAKLMLALGLGLLFSFAPTPSAHANAATQASPEGARQLIEGMAQEAISVLSEKNTTIIKQKFSDLLRSGFDIDGIARFTLGRHWRTATPEQQREYSTLFANYVVGIYANRFQAYSGEELKVVGIKPDGEGYIVNSTIAKPGAPNPIKVDWMLSKGQDNMLRVRDVVIEGVSMGITQRSEFSTIVQNSGGNIEGLLSQLRSRLAQNNRH
jgi:phospholipid transport system substrate-binding protein